MMDQCNSVDKIPKCTKHMIHLALKWREQLRNVPVLTRAQVAAQEGLSHARVTQVMSLLELPVDVQCFLGRLTDPKEIRFFSERRLRRLLGLQNLAAQWRLWEETISEFKSVHV
jgi:hypothetical protein